MKNIKEYIKFLEKHKHLFGFAGWSFTMGYDDSVNVARVFVDYSEKVAEFYIPKSFDDRTKENKTNILIHELVHGRIAAYRAHLQKFIDIEEEELVNDLTRGFEELISSK